MNERFNKIKETIEGIVILCFTLCFISTAGYEYYENDRQIADYVILIYSYLFLILCSIHSINNKIICKRSKENIGLITNYKGKGVVFIVTGLLYYPTHSFYNKLSNYALIGIGIYCMIIEWFIRGKNSEYSPEMQVRQQTTQSSFPANSN